jgi:flagellar hook capping protein FlgD
VNSFYRSFAIVIFGLILLVSSVYGATPTSIYRSVGPGNTADLAQVQATGNTLVVVGGTASFVLDLPDQIGIGDVIAYDSDGNMTRDSLAMITGRTTADIFSVRSMDGTTNPSGTAVPDVYFRIYRAYTSLYNAERGSANSSVPVPFDTWSSGRDLVSNNEVWNIVCYADAPDTTNLIFNGWTTSTTNNLKIFTPYLSNQVGVSQRHTGKWTSTAYSLQIASATCIQIDTNHISIAGLQFNINPVDSSSLKHLKIVNPGAGNMSFSHNIFSSAPTGEDTHGAIGIVSIGGSATLYIWNNIFYDFARTAGNHVTAVEISDSNYTAYVFSNTFYNCRYGIYWLAGSVMAINNIAQQCDDGFYGSFAVGSDYNLSDLAGDAPGTNSWNSTTVAFEDVITDDYHLDELDTNAQDRGIDLTSNIYIAFSDDIDNQTRSGSWDLGADEVVSLATPTPTVTVSPTTTLSSTPTPSATTSPDLTQTTTPTNTPTMTETMVVTPTNTPTNTPVVRVTNTSTMTPSSTPVIRTIRVRNNIIQTHGNQTIGIDVPVPHTQKVVIRVYNQRGKKVATLLESTLQAGVIHLDWKGEDEKGNQVKSGVYILFIKGESFETKQKVAVIR